MNIAVYCGSMCGNDKAFLEGTISLGKWIAKANHNLVYGGCKTGLMGTIADTVLEEGGRVIGVLTDEPIVQARKHPGLTSYHETTNLAGRKEKMIELADAFIALPGGPGTLDEICEVISIGKINRATQVHNETKDIAPKHSKPCALFSINNYYEPLQKLFDIMLKTQFIVKEEIEDTLISNNLCEITEFLTKRHCPNKQR